MYELTVDSIHEIFKGYGDVKKIAIFQKNNQWQALVQYPDHQVPPQYSEHQLGLTTERVTVYSQGPQHLRTTHECKRQ